MIDDRLRSTRDALQEAVHGTGSPYGQIVRRSATQARRRRFAALSTVVALVVLSGGIAYRVGQSPSSRVHTDQPGDVTTEEPQGSVVPNVCPGTVVEETGTGDGLPSSESGVEDRGRVEAVLEASRTAILDRYPMITALDVGPGGGLVWDRSPDGTSTIRSTPTFAIRAHLEQASDCPPPADVNTSYDGVPVLFVVDPSGSDPPSWRELDTGGPVDIPQSAALTGSATHLLIWGGEDAEGYPARNDGTLIDLETGQVRSTSSAPTGPRRGAISHAFGEQFLVLGGADVDDLFTDGAIYDTDTDGWRAVGPAPLDRSYGLLADAVIVGDQALALFQSSQTGGVPGFSPEGWELCRLELTEAAWTGCREVPVPEGSPAREARALLAANATDARLLIDNGFSRDRGVDVGISAIGTEDLSTTSLGEVTIPPSPTSVVDSLAGAVLLSDGTLSVWGFQETAANDAFGVQLPFPSAECPQTGAGYMQVTLIASCGPPAALLTNQGLVSITLPAGGRIVQTGPDRVALAAPANGNVSIWISDTTGN
jgi:hypothetical protein